MAKVLLGLFFFFLVSASNVLAINTPGLESPSLGSTTSDTSPTLSWNWSGTCASSGSCYRVQVDDQADFSSLAKDYYTSNNSYSPQLGAESWYWRVRAKDSTNTWSDWSSVWDFTIDQGNPSPTPTPTPNPSSSPLTSGNLNISLSEFMPNPAEGNEWAEIKNDSNQTVNVGGYKIDDIEGGSSPFTIPVGSQIVSGGFAVFYFSARLNNEGDTARLLTPDGTVLDSYSYLASTKGVSFAKDPAGNWQQTSTPTPGAVNQIITPAPQNSASTSKSKTATTKSTTPTPTTQSQLPTRQVLGKNLPNGRGFSDSASDQNFATPSLNLATRSSRESSPTAQVAGSKKSKLGSILLILGGLVILVAIAAGFAKKFKWKL